MSEKPAPSRKAKVTDEHISESRRLRSLWTAYRTKPNSLTQEAFGGKYGIGSQGAVNQFLKGDTPLSLKAAAGFAEGLGVSLGAFSPRLAAEASKLVGVAPKLVPSLIELGPMEAQLVLMFRHLSPNQQHDLLIKANKLYSATNPGKSAANPFVSKEVANHK